MARRRGREAAVGDVAGRLAHDLRQAILSGQYGPDTKLPSTNELMDREQVANLTVRAAYQQLIEEGLVVAVPKSGYYVRRPLTMTWHMNAWQDPRRLEQVALDGWTADVDAAGYSHHQSINVAVVSGSHRIGDRPVGQLLGIGEDKPAVVRQRVRYIGAGPSAPATEPESLADTYYAYDLVRDTAIMEPVSVNTAHILRDLGYPLGDHVDELRPRMASHAESDALQLPPVTPVLEIARTTHSLTDPDQVVLVLHQIRPGTGATYTYNVRHSPDTDPSR